MPLFPLVVAALLAALALPAGATFEGLNGPIAYQVTRSGLNISAGKVTPGESPTSLSLSGFGYKVDMYYAPDGERLVYTVFDPQNTTMSSLRIQNTVQSGGQTLSIPPVTLSTVVNGETYSTDWYPRHPAFTPDGRGVVFSQAGHIRLYDLDTDTITDLTSGGTPSSYGDYFWPTVSFDGSLVAFQILQGNAIGVMPITGGSFSSIAGGLVIPTWHPSKLEMLAVDVNFGSDSRTFYAVTPAGALTPLHTAPGASVGGDTDLGRFRAVWSPQGDKIAYTVLNEDAGLGAYGNALYTYEVGGANPPEIAATMPSSAGNVWHAVRPTWGSLSGIDLSVNITPSHVKENFDWTLTYDVEVHNEGIVDATGVRVEAFLPNEVGIVSYVSPLGNTLTEPGDDCLPSGSYNGDFSAYLLKRFGGSVACNEMSIAAGESVTLRIVTTVINASDLGTFRAEVNPNRTVVESVYSNNEAEETVELPLDSYTTADTLLLMESLFLPTFDRYSDLRGSENACTSYQDEIYARVYDFAQANPAFDEEFSYGRVTDEGHNGVVIYRKCSNYHQSGIVIHGTAAYSQYGTATKSPFRLTPGGLGQHEYWLTPITDWQQGSGASWGGSGPHPIHSVGFGYEFEGEHPYGPGGAGSSTRSASEPSLALTGSCPFEPDATLIATGSPIDLRITNSVGQRVHTRGAEVILNELPTNFFAYNFFDEPSATVDWDLVLPPDRYVVEIVGTKSGPYTLTLTTFDENGDPVPATYTGTTFSGRSDSFVVALLACPENPVDSDSDGVCNGVDNCPQSPNADQADIDADGFGDACDVCSGPDTDGDAICDDVDNCPDVYNPSQYDEEGDGFGESCDPCPQDEINDPDQDGICAYEFECDVFECNPEFEECCDSEFGECCDPEFEECCDPEFEFCPELSCEDNCPLVSNPDQSDLDFDFVGDACDPCPFDPLDTCPGAQDFDEDGVPDGVDNCPSDPNPDQADGDGDGMGDVCDPQTCGDGNVETGEDCDDGGQVGGDGCSATCTVEPGYQCSGAPSTCAPIASPLDHFMGYKVKATKGAPKSYAFGPVQLTDHFQDAAYRIDKPASLLLPADKNDEGVGDPATHLEEYRVKPFKGEPKFEGLSGVRITNQCNDLLIEVGKPTSLLVPTSKHHTQATTPPDPGSHGLDHFLCYQAKAQAKLDDGTKLPKFPKGIQVDVVDQFQTRRYDLKKITKLCNPVDKAGSPSYVAGPAKGEPKPIEPAVRRNPDDHLVCYLAKPAKKRIEQNGCGAAPTDDPSEKIEPAQPKHAKLEGLYTANQFGQERLDTIKETELCIPSQKLLP